MAEEPSMHPASGRDCRILLNVSVPVRDGVRLATTAYLPLAERPCPVVLVRTAYNRSGFYDAFFPTHGIALVIQDCRGRYGSGGRHDPFIHEADDGFDTIEWLGSQSWCNGEVGMFGDSYLAATQFYAASMGSRFLRALNPRFMAGDCWKRAYYCDGAFSLALTWSWLCFECASRVSQANSMPLLDVPQLLRTLPLISLDERSGAGAVPHYRDYVRRSRYDAGWQALRIREQLGRYTMPVLLVGGWYDYYAAETVANFTGLRSGMASRQEPVNKAVKCIRTKIDQIPCEWVVAPGADPDIRLLYLHGGGYVSGSGASYLPLAADLSTAARCAVFLPDYRLAPEHRFPAGLEDCIRAHEWLTANGPAGAAPARATFIAGDSAGGGLTLATLLALRDRRMPLPLAGMPLSAFTDLTLAGESIRSEAETDPVMSPRCLPKFVELYLGDADPRNPLASSIFGDYTGIPPLLIQVGEVEVIRDDSVGVAAKARADGVDVKLEVWPGQVHVFQVRGLPESREAIEHIAGFMQSCLKETHDD